MDNQKMYIDLSDKWDDLVEKIYDILSGQPTNDLANEILDVLSETAEKHSFIELPCEVGETMYEIVPRKRGGKLIPVIVERTVESFEISRNDILWVRFGTTMLCSMRNLGDTIFFNRKDAEKKIKERESKNG